MRRQKREADGFGSSFDLHSNESTDRYKQRHSTLFIARRNLEAIQQVKNNEFALSTFEMMKIQRKM